MLVDIVAGSVLIIYSLVLFFTGYAVGRRVKDGNDDCTDKEYEKQETVLQDIKAEIKQWYWDADKQTLRTDPCVVDSMIDLFLRTINKHLKEVENANSN